MRDRVSNSEMFITITLNAELNEWILGGFWKFGNRVRNLWFAGSALHVESLETALSKSDVNTRPFKCVASRRSESKSQMCSRFERYKETFSYNYNIILLVPGRRWTETRVYKVYVWCGVLLTTNAAVRDLMRVGARLKLENKPNSSILHTLKK